MMASKNDIYLQTKQNGGFTLVELMIALAVSGIVMSAVITAFISQKTSSTTQTKVAIMQQNLRAAMSNMTREIRMAAYDPVTDNGGISFIAQPPPLSNPPPSPSVPWLTFTREIDSAGTLQTIDYRLYDAYGDGDNDLGVAYDGNLTALAENIDALEFVYLDSAGNQTANVNNITTVQISILARADTPDENYFNSTSYFPASCPQPQPPAPTNDACLAGNPNWDFDGIGNNTNAFNDRFRRRLLVTTVQLRN